MEFQKFLTQVQQQVEQQLNYWLPETPVDITDPAALRLHEAMRYGVYNGGKRIRPLFTYASAQALGGSFDQVHGVACAVELIHCYSLVHDDLPAMDNDDLRRGKPTCHKAYDDATAILVGDALQTLAYRALIDHPGESVAASDKVKMLTLLTDACGAAGLAGGQAMDLACEQQPIELDRLENIHRLKTARLIQASIQLAALAVGGYDSVQWQALSRFGDLVGVSFQVRDDILDVEGDTAVIGKSQGADQQLGKSTYVSVLGLAGAKSMLADLHQQANDALQPLGPKADVLREISGYVVARES